MEGGKCVFHSIPNSAVGAGFGLKLHECWRQIGAKQANISFDAEGVHGQILLLGMKILLLRISIIINT